MPLVPYDPTGDSTNPGSEALMVNEDGLVCEPGGKPYSGLAKCRTLVYFAHNGRKVPGAVLNDKEGPLAHQALVHTGQQR